MALKPGKWFDPESKENPTPLYGDLDGDFQARLQLIFLIVAGLCAPLILFPKPCILKCMAPKRHTYSSGSKKDGSMEDRLLDHEELGDDVPPQTRKPDAPVHEEFDFGEVFVHQVIETIEFVLGCVSNTASYLRLWALSLAHSQLAAVFFENTLGKGISSGSFVLVIFGYAIFAMVTLGVLLLMDQMECFLHALRLHWVEFQSKFYRADGHAFAPLSFEQTLKSAVPKN